jgi:hypothetical protein
MVWKKIISYNKRLLNIKETVIFGLRRKSIVIAIICLALGLSGCNGGPSDPKPDTTPPSVVEFDPDIDAVNVLIGTNVEVVFSEPVDFSMVTSVSFNIDNSVTGQFSQIGDTVTFEPSAVLDYLTTYTVSLTTDITDTAGNNLDSAYSWSFTTEPDPTTIPPVVIATNPVGGSLGVPVDQAITATFSKDLNPSTVTTSSFLINNGVIGTVTYASQIATFTPDADPDYSTTYTATLTTDIIDIDGFNLAADFIWTFTTQPDPLIPVVSIQSPEDEAIVGNTVTITAQATHPIGIDRVEFYIDGIHIVGADDNSPPYEYIWDASGSDIGSEHIITARAYDADSRMGVSLPVGVYYLWEELANDINDFWHTDIKRVLARSTDDVLEMRYEFWESWEIPYADTSLDMGIYFDTDQNASTGRRDFAGTDLNDIGAEYRIIIGIHGTDTALAFWSVSNLRWEPVFDTTGYVYYNVPENEQVMEFGLNWSDLGNPSLVYMVSINLFFTSPTTFYQDWVPDLGSGHITVYRENRYVGRPRSIVKPQYDRVITPEGFDSDSITNPFD